MNIYAIVTLPRPTGNVRLLVYGRTAVYPETVDARLYEHIVLELPNADPVAFGALSVAELRASERALTDALAAAVRAIAALPEPARRLARGALKAAAPPPCQSCDGRGRVEMCPTCGGDGRVGACAACEGTGHDATPEDTSC